MGRGIFRNIVIEAQWLNDSRARGYARLLAILFPLAALLWTLASLSGKSLNGEPLGTDFLSFWTASQLALAGHPAAPYDPSAHHAAQIAVMGWDPGYFAFFYPPPYLLACLPLALLPYAAALAAWIALTGLAYLKMLRAWTDDPHIWIAMLAFPAVLINAGHGQNGFLTAALVGGGLILMNRKRPWLSGLLLGALVIKPHLAILLPLALAARGEWRTFLATGLGAMLWAALSFLAFGPEAWHGFLADSALARQTLEQGLVDPAKMQSAFAAVRVAGGSLTQAYAAQAAGGIAVALTLVALARLRAPAMAQNAAFALAAILATPFVFDYDLTWIALPLGWLLVEGRRTGFLPYEKLVMAAAFLLPLIGRSIAIGLHVPIAPFLLAALFALVVRRAVHGVSLNRLLPRRAANG
ncbi:MAG: glycosyltransferase family 87 protein [Sphingobium phenoxybenzoativorans]